MPQRDMYTAPTNLTLRDDTYPFISPSRFTSSLSGKRVLITGAGRGIGRTVSLAFASAGASLALVGRTKSSIDAVSTEAREKYQVSAVTIAANVSESGVAERIVREAEEGLGGPIDILINNAGVTRFAAFADEAASLDDWWKVLEVNLRGSVALTRAVLPGMISQKSGTMISMASTAGSLDLPFMSAYSVSKAAIIKFHQDLQAEVEDEGIVTYIVHPGTVATELGTAEGAVPDMSGFEKYPKMKAMMEESMGMQKQTPELAADTIVALCADEKCRRYLKGRYVDSQQDLEEVLADAEKCSDSRLEKEKLYHLKLEEL